MNCGEARTMMLDEARGRLSVEDRARLGEHTSSCEACAHEARVQVALTGVLEARLPRYEAPASLRRKLARIAAERGGDAGWQEPAKVRGPGWWRAWAPTAVAAAALAMSAGAFWMGTRGRPAGDDQLLVREAVNDHLRITFADHPVEIASGGIHQVKPWFSGKVDFAPIVPFAGDEEFPLVGGSVAYFVDRKAAAFIFKRRLHTISLLVFPPDGLDWHAAAQKTLDGGLEVQTASLRGFHVLLWQDHGLGYALVSDVDPADLEILARRLTARP